MLTIERCRQILGERAQNLTDKEVEELRDRVYALADVSLEQALKQLLLPPPDGQP